ncbi:hypothetical protein CPT_Moonbeam221 [Bacillus phage Moonbeam]|uniref:Uncharacterized protein n=1 Tax=Bacillus phage Moonbeam TaxID=1540091 RepID=A0A0A0RPR9_9CAUD|nr:hypothetical protein CPT_Moonbeam221 [Bacillus phage Moonbeam]AIW03619.1 hypothetical protein CPT_Moonbeam221 [Bacillus phage Moonbeam]
MSSTKTAKAEEKRVKHIMDSLTRYYTGKENSLDNASELFKGLITVPGLIVPADDVIFFKSLVVPAIFIQTKGRINLIELHECERGLINSVVYNAELVNKFLKRYKTKEETKMKELEGFEILPTIEEDSSEEYKPLLEVLPELKEGDVLEVPSNTMNITVVNTQLVWQDIAGELGSPVDFNLPRLKTPVRIQPKYVGWREALEAYEDGYRIECKYNGKMVWFKRDIASFEERPFLEDKGLVGLLATKWVVK